jgi:hypothetical protein
VFPENLYEVEDMLFSDILNAKVVDYEREADGPPLVFPISWRDFALGVTRFC